MIKGKKLILIIDYDMGNISSINNMLRRIGYSDVSISSDYCDIHKADKLILPGVGAFDQGVRNLKKLGLFDAIIDGVLALRKPILGICLGMQLLGRGSEEGELKGLGLMPFDSRRFVLGDEYKIPNMGWNSVVIKQKDNPLVEGLLDQEQRYYFVHSYHAICDNATDELMSCNYGYDFTAAISRENIYGVQFHPEKSHKYGMKLLENYIRL